MASAMMVSSAAATARAAAPVQTNMVFAFNGLKSTAAFPVTRNPGSELSKLPSNRGRVQCTQRAENEAHKSIKEAYGEVKNTAKDVQEEVKDVADKAIDKAAMELGGKVKDTSRKISDAVADKAEDARESIKKI